LLLFSRTVDHIGVAVVDWLDWHGAIRHFLHAKRNSELAPQEVKSQTSYFWENQKKAHASFVGLSLATE
jgi:hypothetical protein